MQTVVTFYANGIDDFGWTYAHELARASAEQKLFEEGYTVKFINYQYIVDDNATKIALEYASNNVTMLIFTSAGYYESAINAVFKLYPSIPILSLTASRTSSSVNLFPKSYQGYYLAGLYCGSITTTNVVGHLGINPIAVTASEVNAFYIGAKTSNPGVQVKFGFMDVYYDPFLERYSADYMLKNWEIDCAISQSFEANAAWNNITVIGQISDMRYVVGEHVAFSSLYRWDKYYYQYILEALEGNFTGGKFIYEGLGDMIELSHFSTLAEPAARLQIQKSILQNKVDSVFCPPYYDKCLAPFEIATMSQFLPGAINPRNFTRNEFIETITVSYDDYVGIILTVLSSIGILASIVLIILVYINRNTKTIIASSPLFCYFVIIGAAIAFASIFLWMDSTVLIKCQLRIWLVSLAYSFSFGSLMIKNIRIMYLFYKTGAAIVRVTNVDLIIKGTLPLLMLEFSYLIIWVSVDLYQPVIVTESPLLQPNEQYIMCQSTSLWGSSIFLALKGLLLIAGVVIGYRVRKIKSIEHRETNAIALTIYNSVLIFVIAIIVLITVPLNIVTETLVICLAIILIGYCILLFVFVPKFLRIYKQNDTSATTQG